MAKKKRVEWESTALGRAATKARGSRAPVEGWVGGEGPGVGGDEILVVVLGQRGAVASSRKLRGRSVSLRDLRLRLAGAEAAVDQLSDTPSSVSPQLTRDEATML